MKIHAVKVIVKKDNMKIHPVKVIVKDIAKRTSDRC